MVCAGDEDGAAEPGDGEGAAHPGAPHPPAECEEHRAQPAGEHQHLAKRRRQRCQQVLGAPPAPAERRRRHRGEDQREPAVQAPGYAQHVPALGQGARQPPADQERGRRHERQVVAEPLLTRRADQDERHRGPHEQRPHVAPVGVLAAGATHRLHEH